MFYPRLHRWNHSVTLVARRVVGWWPWTYHLRALPAIFLLVGLGLSASAWWTAGTWAEKKTSQEKIDSDLGALHDLTASFRAEGRVDGERFRQYSREVLQRHEGIEALEGIPARRVSLLPSGGLHLLRWLALAAGLLVTGLFGFCLEKQLRRGQQDLERKARELRSANKALFDEKERAQVTLRSIGDAVITTDAEGRIRFMNPVAEKLTGWSSKEARTTPLSQVLHLVDETTREPMVDPVAQYLEAGETMGPENIGLENMKDPGDALVLSRSGEEFPVQESVAPIRDQEGSLQGLVLVIHDASAHRQLLSQMAYQASHDALTGLVNRREFELRLAKLLEKARNEGKEHALCYLDLDHFKVVNDALGHGAGDELLKELTALLLTGLGAEDTLARLGGDEFGLLLEECSLARAKERAQALTDAVHGYHFTWGDKKFEVGASFGVVAVTAETESLGEALAQADIACYSAKEKGGNRVYVYNPDDNELTRRREAMSRATELITALEAGRFHLYGQAIYALQENSAAPPSFFEVLLRLEDSDGTLLSPASFIPAAERFGIMTSIDRWVVRTTLEQFAKSQAAYAGYRVSINLSGNSLADATFLDYVQREVKNSMVPAKSICFEITETAAIRSLNQATRFIRELKKLGCTFALDDFGSGLSSFSYLRQLPVDFLKIDGEFVKDMSEDTSKQAMVVAIHEVSRIMGLETIAECVTSPEVTHRLRKMGVEYAQGYALSRPMPLGQLLAGGEFESAAPPLAASA